MKKNCKSKVSISPLLKFIVFYLLNMRRILFQISIFLLTGSVIFGQFKKDIPDMSTFPLMGLGNSSSSPLFSPDRLQMNHGFNFSISSLGGKSFNTSSYTNSISYLLKPNLMLHSNFTLFQTPGTLGQQGEIGYDLSLSYKPSKNSMIQFSVQKLPFNYRRSFSPFSLNQGK